MNRDDVLNLLRAHKMALAQRFGVVEVRLYGSFARDQASGDSDVDVLVRFDAPPDWRRYFDAQAYLEELLGRPVDMATSQELRAEIRPYVERELIRCLMPSQGFASGQAHRDTPGTRLWEGEPFEESLGNLYEAVEGWLSVDVGDVAVSEKVRVLEIAI